jgi:tripartite-type tricarboxylate transporter receptor subunit TctC
MKRTFLACFASVIAALIVSPINALAQTKWPDKPLKIVVPYPPGGPLDIVARLLAQKAEGTLKQTIIVENKPGAGGNIGADSVAKSAPDGITLLMGAVATHAINPALYPKMPYDAKKDFTPLLLVAKTPNVLIVNPSVPANTVDELIAHAKAKAGKLNFASGSNGSAGHLAGELMKMQAGIDMQHIPYKGGPAALQSLLAGDTQLMFDNLANAMPHIKSGKVRAIAVTTSERSKDMPQLPTMAQASGALKEFDISTWFGLFLPAGVAAERRATLIDAFSQALTDADVRSKMDAMGASTTPISGDAFAKFIDAEAAKYAKVIKASGATVD